jgi:hypothetical protein
MIGLSVESVKQNILDRQKVMDAADRASERALSRFGAFVRTRASRSMRPRKRVSDVGAPPSSHSALIRDFILFVVEAALKNVVIGPMLLHKVSPTALSSLEHGGPSLVMRHGKPTPIQVKARPFMKPAFDIEIEKAPKLWENALR